MRMFDNGDLNCVVDFGIKRQKEILTSDGKPLMSEVHVRTIAKNLVLAGIVNEYLIICNTIEKYV